MNTGARPDEQPDEKKGTMQTLSFSAINRLATREKEAERIAITVLRGTSFTECLIINSLSPQILVLTPTGKEATIRGSDIYKSTTWDKFLLSINQANSDLCQLTDVVDNLTEHYEQWLLNNHTKRYKGIKKPEDMTWLNRIVRLVVTRRIMENKYEAYIMRQDQDAFADQGVAWQMNVVMSIRETMVAMSKALNHVLKKPENKELRDHLLIGIFDEHYQRMKRIPAPSPEVTHLLDLVGSTMEEISEESGEGDE